MIHYDSIVIGDASQSNAIYSHAAIKNITEHDIEVKVKRLDKNFTTLTDNNAICWGICHLPEVSESTISITIEAGQIDSLNFTGHVYPDKDGIPSSGEITYVFFDENNPADSISIVVQYQVVLTSSVNEMKLNRAIQLFPNPSGGLISLQFKDKNTDTFSFRLYTLSGTQVYEIKINNTNKSTKINLSDIPKGIYMYSLSEDFKIFKTGKLLLN